MKFVSPLTDPEYATLKEMMKNHGNYRVRMRAHSILLSSKGYKRKEIAKIYSVKDLDTISTWFNRWHSIGLVGLFDDERSGRPPLLSDEEKMTFIEMVKISPNSLKLALTQLFEKVEKTVSIDTLKRLLKSRKFSWRRARKTLKHKRNQEKFEQSKLEINMLKQRYHNGEIDLRYFDESGLDLVPSVPYAWQPKGETIELPAARSSRITVLGFLNLDCGLDSYVFTGKITSEVVVTCFDRFVKKITKPTYVIIDNASIHASALFKHMQITWEKQGLFLKFLPPYSPELNLIEILWRFIKYTWLNITAYKNFETLNNSLDHILKNVGKKYRITFA
jgi:transposase